MRSYFVVLTFGLFVLTGIQVASAQISNTQGIQLFFIGDAGLSVDGVPSPALQALQRKLALASKEDIVVFLGDNSYPIGLPDSSHRKRKQAELQLDAQLSILREFKGRPYFIPGNHDWNKGTTKDGYRYVLNQQKYITEKLNRDSVFLPYGACPGPVAVTLRDKLLLILIDTQWLLNPQSDPHDSICDVHNETDFFNALEDIIESHYDWQIIVAGHHPVYSEGNHGGYFTFKDHLFPLTNLAKPLYIPLPVIGSIYPLYRKYSGNIQDLANERYRALQQSLLSAFSLSPNLVYVSGHEHNLQYFTKQNQHYVVSGSGSKSSHVKKNGAAEFSMSTLGFAKITHSTSDQLKLTVTSVDGEGTAKDVYFRELKLTEPKTIIHTSDSINQSLQIVTSADDKFNSSFMHNLWFGNHYRKEWATPVNVEILDMDTTAGGLVPYKRGGGFQTKSLRLQGKNGKEYVLRSVQKNIDRLVPLEFKNTFLSNIVYDQLTSAHPYAALAIPRLADAAGILHTNPRLVFVPNSPRLKHFANDFANTLCLFEERPNGKGWENDDQFEYAEEIINSLDLIKKIRKDNKHAVDQMAFSKARLFDMLINDWDRHEDQWLWAEYKKKGKTMYKPIPRDRDQPFACYDGILPYAATRNFGMRKLHSFTEGIGDLKGLNQSGGRLDREFSNELDAHDWKRVASELQDAITDDVIEQIVLDFPTGLDGESSEEIVRKLKIRKNALVEYALQHYENISKEIEVFGSNKHERFTVIREPETTTVTVLQITKEGVEKDTIYHRVIDNAVTHEIRLYGLAGRDQFFVRGDVKNGIRIRIIGGDDYDSINDVSRVQGIAKKTIVYDTPDNGIQLGSESLSKVSEDPNVNYYERQRTITYDRLIPKVTPGYNPDDGVFIGGGFKFQKQKWRKAPFGYELSLWGNYALATGASNILFSFRFTDVFNGWDFLLDGSFNLPLYVMNYYGLGNDTERSSDREFNRIRAKDVRWQPAITKTINDRHMLNANLLYQWVDVEATPDRFITDPAAGLDSTVFDKNQFAGAGFQYTFKIIDSEVFTQFGFQFTSSTKFYQNIDYAERRFLNLNNSLSLHIPIGRLVIAHRTGYALNIGNNFEFYQANTLGSEANLRGFRRTRFAGKSAFYQNTEFRLKLTTIHSYVFRGSIGILGLIDDGRVWMPDENSSTMHVGYGGGLYILPYNKVGFTFVYSTSNDDRIFQARLGFLF